MSASDNERLAARERDALRAALNKANAALQLVGAGVIPPSESDVATRLAQEIERLRADLAAARELLQSLRSLVPEAYRHHITTALAGEKK